MGLFDEFRELRGRKGRSERLPMLRLSSPRYAKDTRSGKPEAMLKITSFARGARVKKVIEYITRANKKDNLEFENQDGSIKQGKADIKELYEKWRGDFERKKPGGKREPRHATHIILSASAPNDVRTANRVHAAAREFLKKEFEAQGYEYVFVTHRDKDNPHVHVVVKNYNRTLDAKLRLDKHDLLELRRSFAAELQEQGIEQVATRKLDRPLPAEKMKQHIESLKKRETWYDRMLKKAPGGADLFAERKRLARGVLYLKQEVKKATLPLTANRAAAMRPLRELDARLTQVSPEQFRQEAQGTVAHLQRQVRGYAKTVEGWHQLEKRAGERQPPNHTQRLARRRFTERFAERYVRELNDTAAEVRKNTQLAGGEKQALLKIIGEQGKIFQGLARGGAEKGR